MVDNLYARNSFTENIFQNSIIPAVACFKRTCITIDKRVNEILHLEDGILPGGGGYAEFNPRDLVRLTIQGC